MRLGRNTPIKVCKYKLKQTKKIMEKIIKSVAYLIIFIVATPVAVIETIFKSISFILLCAMFIIIMFFAPLFKNFTWPNLMQKFIDYVFSLNFTATKKVFNKYTEALYL